jgi:hypothetical protein
VESNPPFVPDVSSIEIAAENRRSEPNPVMTIESLELETSGHSMFQRWEPHHLHGFVVGRYIRSRLR